MPSKPLTFTSVRIMAHELPWDSWSVGAACGHTLVTVKCDIANSVYIAQVVLIHCQPAASLQINYHYKAALHFWFLDLFLADADWPWYICTRRTKKKNYLKVQNKFQKSWIQISRVVPERENCAAHLGCAVAAEFHTDEMAPWRSMVSSPLQLQRQHTAMQVLGTIEKCMASVIWYLVGPDSRRVIGNLLAVAMETRPVIKRCCSCILRRAASLWQNSWTFAHIEFLKSYFFKAIWKVMLQKGEI